MKRNLIFTICLLSFSCLFAKNTTYKESFPNNIDTLEIDLVSEDINIISTSGADFSVEIDSNYKKYQPDVYYENNKLIIKAKPKFIALSYRCNVELCIPQSVKFNEVFVHTVSGDININSFICEDASISSTSGTIQVDSISADYNNSIKSTSGSIKVKKLSGDAVSIHTTSGDIEAAKIESYESILESVSGDVNIKSIDAETFDIKTVSGAVKLFDVFASNFNVNTTSGSVSLEFADLPIATSKIKTNSGSVDLYVTKIKGFDLIYQTNSGTLKDRINTNNFSPRGEYRNSYFGGGPEIQVRTTSGSLELDK